MSFAETRRSREMSRMASGERYPSVSWTFFRRGRRPFRLSRILCWTASAIRTATSAALQQGRGVEPFGRPLLPFDALPEVHILAFRIPRLERGPQGEILCRETPVDLPPHFGRGVRP